MLGRRAFVARFESYENTRRRSGKVPRSSTTKRKRLERREHNDLDHRKRGETCGRVRGEPCRKKIVRQETKVITKRIT